MTKLSVIAKSTVRIFTHFHPDSSLLLEQHPSQREPQSMVALDILLLLLLLRLRDQELAYECSWTKAQKS